MWTYEGKPFTQSEYKNGMHSFVYQIECLDTGMKYIGKKNFNSKKKGVYGFSDWEKYQSSSDIAKKWKNVDKKILRICYCPFESSYYEVAYMIAMKALLRDDYCNYLVGREPIGRCPDYLKVKG